MDDDMQTITEDIGAYASTLKYEDLPAEVIHQAKRFIADTVGCAFGGFASQPCDIARELAAPVTSSQPAASFWSGAKHGIEPAAFATAVRSRLSPFKRGSID